MTFMASKPNLGENIEASISKDGKLTLVVDLTKRLRPSKTGKTTIVASSDGNKQLDGTGGVVIGLNIYTK